MHIILIYEKKTIRNQCVATKTKEGKWRNAGDFLGRQSLVAKEKLPLTQCQARNVRKRMSMMFLYILLLYSFACALKKNPLNPIASSSIGACWFHEQLQAAAAAAESSFPLFLRFTPLFFSNKNKNSVTNHKTTVRNVFSFVFPLMIVFRLFRNERASHNKPF